MPQHRARMRPGSPLPLYKAQNQAPVSFVNFDPPRAQGVGSRGAESELVSEGDQLIDEREQVYRRMEPTRETDRASSRESTQSRVGPIKFSKHKNSQNITATCFARVRSSSVDTTVASKTCQNVTVREMEDSTNTGVRELDSTRGTAFVRGLGIVEEIEHQPSKLLHPDLEPEPPPPPDVDISAFEGLGRSRSSQEGDGEYGEVERLNPERAYLSNANIEPDPPPAPDPSDVHIAGRGELGEQTSEHLRAGPETHGFASFCFLPRSLSFDALALLHSESSDHYHARLNVLPETCSLNALACTDPIDPFPIAVPTVNTTHNHTILLNVPPSESLFYGTLPACRNLNGRVTHSTIPDQ